MTKRNLIKRYKGGGTKAVSSIPKWMEPYLKNVGNQAESLYSSGQLDNVAGTNKNLDTAFSSGSTIAGATDTALGNNAEQQARLEQRATSGGYDTSALKDAAILEAGKRTAQLSQASGAAGTLGSARQAVQQGAQNAQTAADFANIDYTAAQKDYENKMAAEQALAQSGQAGQQLAVGSAQALSNLGGQQRDITQQQVDAPWQALQRYASTIYGSPARQQATSSGGGK